MAWGAKTEVKDIFGIVKSVGVEKLDGSVSVHEPGFFGGAGKQVATVNTSVFGTTSVTSPGGHTSYVSQSPFDGQSATHHAVSVAGSVAARLDRPSGNSTSPATNSGPAYSGPSFYGGYGGDYVASTGGLAGSSSVGSYGGPAYYPPREPQLATEADKARWAQEKRARVAKKERSDRNRKLITHGSMTFTVLIIVSFTVWLVWFWSQYPELFYL